MAVQVKVGSFTRPVAHTTNTVVTGVGFQPTSIVFLPSHALTAGTWRAKAQAGAFAIAKNQYGGMWWSGFLLSGDDADTFGSWWADDAAVPELWDSGTQTWAWRAESISFDSDGFQVDWASFPAYDGEQEHIGYLCLGGDAKARSFLIEETGWTGLSAGQRFTIPVNLPFQPSGALVAISGHSGNDESVSFGAWAGSGRQWCLSQSGKPGDTTAAYRRLSDDRVAHLLDQTTGIDDGSFKLVSLSAKEATFEVITAANGIGAGYVGFVVFGDVQMDAGTFAKDTGAAPDAQTVAVVGKPKAALFATAAHTADNAAITHARGSVGVSDGTSNRAVAWNWDDSAAISNGDTLFRTDAALVKANNATPAEEARSAATFAAQQINLSWSPNDAVATRFAYLTFGETTPLSGAATVRVGPTVDFARLAEAHALTGYALVDVGHKDQPAWLGNSAVGTHVLSGAATVAIGGPTVPLRLNHAGKLTGAATVTIAAAHAWPAQSHALSGAALVAVGGPNPLLGMVGASLSGAALIAVSTSGQPARLRVGGKLTGAAIVTIGGASLGLGGADLPLPKALTANDLVGTVNLFRNPDFEAAALLTSETIPLNGAALSLSTAQAWHGAQSLAAALGNTTDSGARLVAQRGLPYFGVNHAFLAQFRARGSITGDITAQSVIVYTDGSGAFGEVATYTPSAAEWATYLVPAAVSNAAKQIENVRLDVRRPLAAAGETLYLDGVQMELDRGQGHTPWAVGTFGEPYHRWWGGAHASITVRDAIPLDARSPGEGEYRIEARMWRANADNLFLEDLTEHVVSAVVTADPERDVSWSLECEMLPEGWAKLTPFVDWLAPCMAVTLPDGTVRGSVAQDSTRGQLGHFVVLPSPREVDEWGERIDVDARSGETLLQMQGTKGIMQVREGTDLIRAARAVLDESHLGVDGKRFRHDLPNDNEEARRDMTWERKEDAGQIVNDLLRKAGKHPLYATKTGVLRSVDRKKRRLRRLDPARVWAANLPAGVSVDPWVKRADATINEVVGTISLTPDLGKWDDNKIVVVSVNPKKPRIRTVRYITDPDNPVNPRKRKRIKERKIEMDVGSNADAEALAEAIAEEIGTKLQTVELSVLPDPETELMRQVVYLAVYDAARAPVAVGRFKVNSVTYGFTADEALMQLSLGFVHSVEQLEAYDPTGWELPGGVWRPL